MLNEFKTSKTGFDQIQGMREQNQELTQDKTSLHAAFWLGGRASGWLIVI